MRLKIIALLAVIVGGAGCDNAVFENTLSRGDDVTIEGCTYMAYRTYAGLCVPVHKGNCTNHAPTVVTNVVTVTQECRHVEWATIKSRSVTNDAGVEAGE